MPLTLNEPNKYCCMFEEVPICAIIKTPAFAGQSDDEAVIKNIWKFQIVFLQDALPLSVRWHMKKKVRRAPIEDGVFGIREPLVHSLLNLQDLCFNHWFWYSSLPISESRGDTSTLSLYGHLSPNGTKLSTYDPTQVLQVSPVLSLVVLSFSLASSVSWSRINVSEA